MTIAEAEGRFVTTIEGLSRDRSHAVQQAWAAEQVTQCGYCDPGFIMAIAALLRANPNPSDAEIEAAITNICRCGIYPRVKPAIRRAIRFVAGADVEYDLRLELAREEVPEPRLGQAALGRTGWLGGPPKGRADDWVMRGFSARMTEGAT